MKYGYSICFNEWALDKSIKGELGLLLIISSLTAEKGYCYATNNYFAELFGIDEVSISRKIKKLEGKGYIEINYIKRGCEVISREIRLTKMLTDDLQKRQSTINKNVKGNNINNNNINNNIPPLYSPQGEKDTLDDLTKLEDSLWYSKGSEDKSEQIGLDRHRLDNQFMGIGDSNKSEDVKQEHPSLDKKNKSPPLVPPQKGELFKEQFKEFWKEYPKKRAGSKDKSYKSWLNAIKRGNSIEKILTGCKNYAKSDEVLRENGKYAKGCSAWLNDDRFNNEYACNKKDLDYYLSQLEKEGKE